MQHGATFKVASTLLFIAIFTYSYLNLPNVLHAGLILNNISFVTKENFQRRRNKLFMHFFVNKVCQFFFRKIWSHLCSSSSIKKIEKNNQHTLNFI
ncbi:hypothetical protein BpHYR1_001018 [Brachionus plicatilis]|uniref:Uncharacterized protein n=1 Tax=Brachionus plicatilis TaxID=10195 RepID=A0A3M7T8D0_BRAPC|nr:hypothetical protein BpHYR1_001018 [Brachionus plicatilis]